MTVTNNQHCGPDSFFKADSRTASQITRHLWMYNGNP
jgi:hypothetical protein